MPVPLLLAPISRVAARLAVVLLPALVVVWAGCGRSGSAGEEPAPGYALTGEIVSLLPERKTLLVQHDEIPGYMPAMTMEFHVSEGDYLNARPGQRIRARLIPEGSLFRLEQIWPDDPAMEGTVAAAAGALRQDTIIRGSRAYREVGENLPDFGLYDQEGDVVLASRFRGRQVMLNFIFTRCPIATMCPAATLRMMETQQAARDAGVSDLELISITLDPEYDTPGVLRGYAQGYGIDTSNFSLLTGPESAIRDLMRQLGILAEFEGGMLKHSLATLLVDTNGRIVHRADGSVWSVEEFVAKMQPNGAKTASAGQ